MRFRNAKELLNRRDRLSFLSVLVSSSCLITIAETSVTEEVFDIIHMVNGFRVERKHLLVFTPTFNETMFNHLSIAYDVTIEHSLGGKFIIFMGISTEMEIFFPQMKVLNIPYAHHWVRGMLLYSKVSARKIYKVF